MHQSYWKRTVADRDREIADYIGHWMPTAIADLPTANSDLSVGDDHWRDAYLEFVRSRLALYGRYEQPTLSQIGYAPREVDPTWEGGYTNAWSKQVTIKADEHGFVQPLNDAENELLDSLGISKLAVSQTMESRSAAASISQPTVDDREFPVLLKVEEQKRAAHREALCNRRIGLIDQSKGLEDILVALPIGVTDRQVQATAVHSLERWIETWGRDAGLGSTADIRSAIAAYNADGGDMGPRKRKELLVSVRNIRSWLLHHQHMCDPATE
jgi:hypothetical protein